jgi:hypothetical protein
MLNALKTQMLEANFIHKRLSISCDKWGTALGFGASRRVTRMSTNKEQGPVGLKQDSFFGESPKWLLPKDHFLTSTHSSGLNSSSDFDSESDNDLLRKVSRASEEIPFGNSNALPVDDQYSKGQVLKSRKQVKAFNCLIVKAEQLVRTLAAANYRICFNS